MNYFQKYKNIFFLITIYLAIFLIFDSSHYCYANQTSESANNASIKEIIIVDGNVIAVSDSGGLKIWDLSSQEKIFELYDSNRLFTTVAQDKFNNIYFGTFHGQILKFNLETKNFHLHYKYQYDEPIFNILFNSLNEPFLIVERGVFSIQDNKFWRNFKNTNKNVHIKRKFLHFFWIRTNRYFFFPKTIFMDSEDVIWMTKNLGGWGHLFYRFDAKKRKIINKSIDKNMGYFYNPKSIFEDDKKHIYITDGSNQGTRGKIISIFENKAKIVYNTDNYRDTNNYSYIDSNGVYNLIFKQQGTMSLGVSAFNPLDTHIYFYSPRGFYKINTPKDTMETQQKFIFHPKDYIFKNEENRNENIYVRQILFDNSRMIIVFYEHGVGIYENQNLTILK